MVPWKKEWCCKLITSKKFLSTRVSSWLRPNNAGSRRKEKCFEEARICWSNLILWSLELTSWWNLVSLLVNGRCLEHATVQFRLTVLLIASTSLIQHIYVTWNAISHDKHELLNVVTAASTKLRKYRPIHKIFERTLRSNSPTSSKIHEQIW